MRYYISCCFLIIIFQSCKKEQKPKENIIFQKQEVYGLPVDILSKSGELFENLPYLPLPFNHGHIRGKNDTIDVLLLSKPIQEATVKTKPIAYFEVKDNMTTRRFILAIPSDSLQNAMPIKDFNQFMLHQYPIKNIIDIYFSNYKGQVKSRVVNWRETAYAEDIITRVMR